MRLPSRRAAAFTLVWATLAAPLSSTLARGEEPAAPPAHDLQVNLIYTVNNFGYTDTCG